MTRKDRLKYCNLQRDPRMSVCIYNLPLASNYVVISGPAIVDDTTIGGQEVWGRVRRVVERYVAPDLVGAYIERWKTEPRVLVTVIPERIATRQPRSG